MTVGDTQPTRPLPEWTTAPPAPRRRHRAWPWILAAVIVAGLAVAAWFIGESIARGIVEKTIREQIVTNLALPADQPIDVQIEGAVLPQLIAGTFDDITVSSDDVPFGQLTGDVTVHATGVAFRGDATAETASGTVSLTQDQLKALLESVQDFPVDSLQLAAPDVSATTELTFLGITVPVGVSLTPSAADGDIVLTPTRIQVAGADVSAADLKARFGSLANAVIKDYTVCIAKYIPAGMTLTNVSVDGNEVVADFSVDGRIASDPALQADGTCAA